jgi:hypothetical protein
MRHAAGQKNRGTGIGRDAAIPDHEIHVTFDDVKNRVFLSVEMKWNARAGAVGLFNQRERAAGLGAIKF